MISLISQCWNEWRRLLIRRSDDGNRIDGNIIMVTTIGKPIIVGVMKEANRFSFILILKDYLFFLWLQFWVKGLRERFGKKFLIGIK